VTFVESDPKAVQLMRKNLTACQLLDQADVRAALTGTFLQRPDWWRGPYDILFADPPYAASEAVDLILGKWQPGLLSQDALMIIEQDSRASLPTSTSHATLIRRYAYGDTALFLYGATTTEAAPS
jgi:16S rRNA G966 N2-methylase RsmD